MLAGDHLKAASELGLPLVAVGLLYRQGYFSQELDVSRRKELDPDALTIGFARRFATYKRAALLLSEPERLERLLDDPARPHRLVLAGKAHPADGAGKQLIERIVRFARERRRGSGIVFVEDYDIALARHLVQGADVWPNTPRRPLEASGTSGMKAGLNGVLDVPILDGRWREGYAPELGWAIGGEETSASEAEQDERDAQALLAVLEEEVVPAFFERAAGRPPERWLDLMRASIAGVGSRFNANRMVSECAERYYLPPHTGAGREPTPAPRTRGSPPRPRRLPQGVATASSA